MDRNKRIIRTSILGIVANVFLASFKAVVGFLAGSVAIVMDAVNNLSDVLSSVITIIGTRLAERPADKNHPFGYGRIEYFSAILISVIVLMAGVSSLVESVKKIFHPTDPEYTMFTLIIIVVAILVKILLGRHVKRVGKQVESDALIASGADAMFDAVITLATLVSAGIMLLWHISIDGWLGAFISLAIIKAGFEMLSSPVNELLGMRISPQFVKDIKAEVLKQPGVHGVFDVIVHSYGHGTYIGSLHVNVLDTTTAVEIQKIDRQIAERLFDRFGLIATVGIYCINTGDSTASRMQKDILRRAFKHPQIHSSHGFYVDFDNHVISFDIMPEYGVEDPAALRDEFIQSLLDKGYSNYEFHVALDNNYSEE